MFESRSPLDAYRDHWYEVGAVLGMAVLGGTVLRQPAMPAPQALTTLNFAALTVHQFEEYKFPGTFPGQFNAGVFKSDRPDRFPLNTQSTLLINTAIAYTFYLLPLAFPRKRWLGIAPVIFGFAQAVGHGLVFPRLAGERYSPGFLASALLHVPIGVRYLQALRDERPISSKEWRASVLYTVGFALAGVLAPQQLLKDKNSPYRFNRQQTAGYLSSDDPLPDDAQ